MHGPTNPKFKKRDDLFENCVITVRPHNDIFFILQL